MKSYVRREVQMSKWYYMETDPPKKPGFYQVAIEAKVVCRELFSNWDRENCIKKNTDNHSSVCFWDGTKWYTDDEYNFYFYGLEFTRSIGKDDIIYAWADVLLPVPTMIYFSKPITIKPADYYLTKEQLIALLDNYKNRVRGQSVDTLVDVYFKSHSAINPDETVTIDPKDYYLTEGQLKSFLKDYKLNYKLEDQYTCVWGNH